VERLPCLLASPPAVGSLPVAEAAISLVPATLRRRTEDGFPQVPAQLARPISVRDWNLALWGGAHFPGITRRRSEPLAALLARELPRVRSERRHSTPARGDGELVPVGVAAAAGPCAQLDTMCHSRSAQEVPDFADGAFVVAGLACQPFVAWVDVFAVHEAVVTCRASDQLDARLDEQRAHQGVPAGNEGLILVVRADDGQPSLLPTLGLCHRLGCQLVPTFDLPLWPNVTERVIGWHRAEAGLWMER
jgi:hypothetical protein